MVNGDCLDVHDPELEDVDMQQTSCIANVLTSIASRDSINDEDQEKLYSSSNEVSVDK